LHDANSIESNDIVTRARFDVVIVCQDGARVDDTVKYGAARATLELARHFIRGGKSAVLVGLSEGAAGATEGVPFVGVRSRQDLYGTLRRMSPIDTLIGCSRADIFLAVHARKRLVYHHGPHLPVGEFAVEVIKRLRIPTIVVSEDSRRAQVSWGIPARQLHIVHNGYNQEAFRVDRTTQRMERRIVFAGQGVHYKGLDVAVQAFALLNQSFPDAEFRVYGSNSHWPVSPGNLWPVAWLDESRSPNWPLIQRELPGLLYCGEVDPPALARAFQSASLLVMPSRVHETFGIVAVEAQACGCLPLLPGQGGFPETMRVGETGYTYSGNTVNALAASVAALWNNGLPTEHQRSLAAEWARQFSWEVAGHHIVELLERSVSTNRRSWQIESKLWNAAATTKRGLRTLRDRIRATVK
jgi:glycosyltransferase involved in cell wall biosynthesis